MMAEGRVSRPWKWLNPHRNRSGRAGGRLGDETICQGALEASIDRGGAWGRPSVHARQTSPPQGRSERKVSKAVSLPLQGESPARCAPALKRGSRAAIGTRPNSRSVGRSCIPSAPEITDPSSYPATLALGSRAPADLPAGRSFSGLPPGEVDREERGRGGPRWGGWGWGR